MYCTKCNIIMPYMPGPDGEPSPCILCGKTPSPSASELLGASPVQIVQETRPEQLKLAQEIELAIKFEKNLVAEAGTGVGKTLALSVPIVQCKRRAVVSTATKILQTQYVTKDLPVLAQALRRVTGETFTFALAKGKSNYACPLFVDKHKGQLDSGFFEWLENTATMDKAELGKRVPKVWDLISAEECIGKAACSKSGRCGYQALRQKVREATIVVANHALVGFDILLRGILFKGIDMYIFDEAHRAAQYLRGAFSARLTRHTMGRLDKYAHDQLGMAGVSSPITELTGKLDELGLKMFKKLKSKKFGFDIIGSDLPRELPAMSDLLREGLDKIGWTKRDDDKDDEYPTCGMDSHEALAVRRRLWTAQRAVDSFMIRSNRVNYAEYQPDDSRKNTALISAPIELGEALKEGLFDKAKVVAVSATLYTGGTPKVFMNEMGFDEDQTNTAIMGSPFDYHNRALLYCSTRVPKNPFRASRNDDSAWDKYYAAMADEVDFLVRAADGHALVLFSSVKEMSEVFWRTEERLVHVPPGQEIGVSLRMQDGKETTESLEKWFRSAEKPVLFGVKSFWEGISVEGEQLRLVIIAKLPFPSEQTDPIYAARKRKMELNGMKSMQVFQELAVPAMILDMKQAAGRLMRTAKDFGVVAVLDAVLAEKGKNQYTYAGKLLKDLPFTRITTNRDAAAKFLGTYLQWAKKEREKCQSSKTG